MNNKIKRGLKATTAFVAALTVSFGTSNVKAIPRFSLLTGTRCSVCHFNPQGSGVRTELGWEMMNKVGLSQWSNPADDTSGKLPSNLMFDGHAVPGGDARFQLVRLSTTGQELLIPMQLSGSLGLIANQQLTASTNINLASIYVRAKLGTAAVGTTAGLYSGETDYDAMIQYQPDITLPSIRVGMIQPSIGVRQDDHTEFVREESAINGTPLFAPYYNDVGAELTYEGIRWLTINAGVFNAKNLALADPSIGTVTGTFDFSHPTMSARVMLWPQDLEKGLNGELGASILKNGSFEMFNVFAGIGLADKSTIYIEGLYGKNADDRIIRNFSVLGSMELLQYLAIEWRYDYGQTELAPGQALSFAHGFLFGLEFFPWPYIEIRPEYRLLQTNPFYGQGTYQGQWTGQIHVFY